VRVEFDFNLKLYFARRFPVLFHEDKVVYERPSAVYRWPNGRSWKLNAAEKSQLELALDDAKKPPPFDLNPETTIEESLALLDEWLIKHLRSALPGPVRAIAMLSAWLQDQWRLYSERPLPKDYFWDYVRTLSVGQAKISVGARKEGGAEVEASIPPLTGHVEVFAYRHNDPEAMREWLNQEYPVHLCDRLDDIFDVEQDERAQLHVDYCLGHVTRRCLEKMAKFGYWPDSVHPSEHWFLRRMELAESSAAHVMSLTIPSQLARSISEKSTKSFNVLSRVAAAVANELSALQVPIGMRDEFIVRSWKWGIETSKKRSKGRPVSSWQQRAWSMYSDHPRDKAVAMAMRELLQEFELRRNGRASVTGTEKFDPCEVFDNWRLAKLFARGVAATKAQWRNESQQELFELHRLVAETLETLARRRFREDRFATTNSQGKPDGFNNLFQRWISNRCGTRMVGKKSANQVYEQCYENLVRKYLLEPAKLTVGSAPRMRELLEKTLQEARIQAAIHERTSQWRQYLAGIEAFDTDASISDVVIGGRILIELRNLLAHGTIENEKASADEVVLVNYEKDFSARLDLPSLAICYRLLIAVAVGIHAD
jgi:hypothetical protein